MRSPRSAGRRVLLSLVVVAGLVLMARPLAAQGTGAIRGTVLNAQTGTPVAGVQVSIPELETGTITNADGEFTVEPVPPGEHTLRAELIGYNPRSRTVEVTAGQAARVTIRIRESAVEVEGLVVTALGISRQEQALGYAVQDIQGAELEEVPEVNFMDHLSGKVSGVQVKSIGPVGGTTRITLRGNNSIAGSNQPLIVVDGVPLNNNIRPPRGHLAGEGPSGFGASSRGGIDYGNAAQDLDPSNIESISVLKGANAAAIYGSRAANGVIEITTKSGSSASGVRIQASTSYTTRTPLKVPDFQDVYGGGSIQEDYKWVDGRGGGIGDGIDESYGPKMDGTMYQQWDPFAEDHSSMQPFVPHAYNVRDFWENGYNWTSNASIAAAGENAHARASVSRMEAAGVTPNHEVDRTTVSLSGGVTLGEDLSIRASGQYIGTEGLNRPSVMAADFSVSHIFTFMQRQVDMNKVEAAYDLYDPDNPPCDDPILRCKPDNYSLNFHPNPYYLQGGATKGHFDRDLKHRTAGRTQVDYDLDDVFTVGARLGTDVYSWEKKEEWPYYNHDLPQGGFFKSLETVQETNAEVNLRADADLTDDIGLQSRVAVNQRWENSNRQLAESQRLNVPGIFNPSNSAVPPILLYETTNKRVLSVYGLASFSYRDAVYFDVTARNDWSSTLPVDNNAYFYPSFSSSLVLTEAFDDLQDVFSFAKLRGSWARVGSDARPYQLRSTFQATPLIEGAPGFTKSDQIANRNLRPEQTESWEVGADVRFADDRLNLDLTYYSETTTDQILDVRVSETSGYSSQLLNAGKLTNRGFEVVLDGAPVRQEDGISWNVSLNWDTNRNEVVELHEDVEAIVIGSWRGLTVEAREGEEYGALVGPTFSGKVTSQGIPIPTQSVEVLGKAQPDWTAGLRNSFNYQGLNLSFLFDVRQGGELFCTTCNLLRRIGQHPATLEGREEGGRIHPGTKPNGEENDIRIPLREFWLGRYEIPSYTVYDASFVKLREVSMGFNVPDDWMRAIPFSSGRISLIGRNLALWSNIGSVDPETSIANSNFQGVEHDQHPHAQSLGVRVQLTR